jgi:diacylglycerol kinase family enzyme
MTQIAVFLNPHATKNRQVAANHASSLQSVLGDRGRVWETRSLAELRAAVQEAFDDDALYYVADGGDGSFNCVLHELRLALESWGCDADDVPPLTPTRSGAIDFLARKVGIDSDTTTILRDLVSVVRTGREPPIQKVESLRLTGTRLAKDGQEQRFERLGFAVAAGGIGQRFFTKYDRETPGPEAIVKVVTKAVGSHLSSRLRVPLPNRVTSYGDDVFRPTRARVAIDGEVLPEHEHNAIHAGSCDVSLGGVFRVFPLARDPGVLHFQAGRMVPQEMIRSLPRLVRGDAIGGRHLVERAGREMTIEALGSELLNPVVDGEQIDRVKTLRVAHGPAIPILRGD